MAPRNPALEAGFRLHDIRPHFKVAATKADHTVEQNESSTWSVPAPAAPRR
jgi:hypothetical protein